MGGRSASPRSEFAVKMPKLISHERLLTRSREPLERFLEEIGGLGDKLGPLLLQLPPSFAFDARRAGRFLELLAAATRARSWSSRGTPPGSATPPAACSKDFRSPVWPPIRRGRPGSASLPAGAA